MVERARAGNDLNRRHMLLSLAATPLVAALPRQALAGSAATAYSSLSGDWRLTTDPHDRGIMEHWYSQPLKDEISLPGSLEDFTIGNAVTPQTPWTGDINDKSYFNSADYAEYRKPGNVKVPFFLQPDTWFRGPVWYQREVTIPDNWHGKRVTLYLERPHWETRVWLGGREIGQNNALHVPHVYDLDGITPGTHLLNIRVDNRMIVEIGHNGHGVTDHTQGNWNGIAGRIELRAYEPVWIDGVELYPDLSRNALRLKGRIGSITGKAANTVATINFAGQTLKSKISWDAHGGQFDAEIQVNPANTKALAPWDEFSPVVHEVTVTLPNGEFWMGRFGWRKLEATPAGFLINGRPMMFRGALECGIFPKTGHPATDIETWRRIMGRVKSYGLNHLRFHSYCPPEAAFDAADEAGIYMQIETVWANQSVAIGSGLEVDRWVYQESDRILAAHGNHPSFVLMTHGNEPGGGRAPDGNKKRDAFLSEYVAHYRKKDARRLWTSGAGWPEIPENEFHVTPTPRIHQWGEELKSRINAKPPETVTDYSDFVDKRQVPVISHEIGQWCVYPNLTETRKYDGYLKAKNFEIFADRLREHNLLELAPEFLYASGRLQTLCYKEEIESALRTHKMGGFQLLGLQDFPGQGTALVGVVDPFWDDKGYVTPSEYRRFCGPVTPLARLTSRILQSGETLSFAIDVAQFGPSSIYDAKIIWRVAGQDGSRLANGGFATQDLPCGNKPLGLTAQAVLSVEKATRAKLIVEISSNGHSIAENDWDIWVYPKTSVSPHNPKILRADRVNKVVLDHLNSGGDVLLGVLRDQITPFETRPVKPGFSSIFWNTLWTEYQAPTTLGIVCDPQHPALADFPTDSHSNWQWWYLMHRAGAFRLDLLPDGVEPIVRVIDDWFTARPLGLILELNVGKGRILMCGFSLETEDPNDLVSRQLVKSLLQYMESDAFKPAVKASERQLKDLLV